VGIPLIYILSTIKIKLPLNRFLGSLSYGVFLSHFLSIWIIEYSNLVERNSIQGLIYIIILSFIIAMVGVYVENYYIR
jgi:peptidoglycan/LPS O-acetylase OafA/YrhL